MGLTKIINEYELVGKVEKCLDKKPIVTEIYYHKKTGEIIYKTKMGRVYPLVYKEYKYK